MQLLFQIKQNIQKKNLMMMIGCQMILIQMQTVNKPIMNLILKHKNKLKRSQLINQMHYLKKKVLKGNLADELHVGNILRRFIMKKRVESMIIV